MLYFRLPVGLAALSVELWGGSGEAVEAQMNFMRTELKDAPYLREIGRFQVVLIHPVITVKQNKRILGLMYT
ncbi:hypothetical protein DFQ00_103315 [Paenibacillus barcinonensis]|uniref:Uncharacterized protein n=1 Tax=Paenibacillus barcinonensis TaxID=198119 RepID=A0A2V4VMT2_PAEBA|nr:hypothetical protein DFQ00_103315 [Paenibacillus barcinonensis]